MDIDNLKQASLEFIRDQYLKYLNILDVGKSTTSTTYLNTFYICRASLSICYAIFRFVFKKYIVFFFVHTCLLFRIVVD